MRVAADIVQRRAEHHRDRCACAWNAPRRPFIRSSIGSVPFSKNSSISASSPSATISTSFSCAVFGGLGQIRGNLLDLGLAVAVGRVDMRLHGDQIDHAAEILLRADRQLQRHDVAAEHAR